MNRTPMLTMEARYDRSSDKLDRLLGLLERARAELDARVDWADSKAPYRSLLAAIEGRDPYQSLSA